MFAFIHELGHLFAGLLLGMKPEKLEVTPYGISVAFKLFPSDYNKKILKGNLLELIRKVNIVDYIFYLQVQDGLWNHLQQVIEL